MAAPPTTQLPVDSASRVERIAPSSVEWKQLAAYSAAAVACAAACAIGFSMYAKSKRAQLAVVQEAFMDAVRDCDTVTVAKLLAQHKIDVNAVIGKELPLIAAVHSGEPDTVCALIKAGACVNAITGGETTALMAACTLGHADTAKLLLAAGARCELMDEAGFHAAHMAAKMGHLDCLRALMAADASVVHMPRVSDGATPLMLAAAESQGPVVRWLCSRPDGDINAKMVNGVTALMAAVKDDRVQCAAILLECGADVNSAAADGRTPLAIAVQHHGKRCAELLLSSGASVSFTHMADDVNPLVIAARKGNCEMISLLCEYGADVNLVLADGRSLLLSMVDGVRSTKKSRANDPPVVRLNVIELLLDLEADPHALSQERASDNRRDSFVVRRSAFAAARASQNEDIIRAFEERIRVVGGEPH